MGAAVAPQHGFIFAHVPRTAGTSLNKKLSWLRTSVEYPYDREASPARQAAIHAGHGRIKDMANIFGRHRLTGDAVEADVNVPQTLKQPRDTATDAAGKLYCFSYVRNPWDRYVSAFHQMWVDPFDKENPGPVFRSWFHNIVATWQDDNARRVASQIEYIVDYGGHIVPQAFRFEDLRAEWVCICRALRFDYAEHPTMEHLGHANHSNLRKPDYREYYDVETADLVRKHQAADVERLGYDFEQKAAVRPIRYL